MIGWWVPLETFPDTYNGEPLGLAALGSQKNYISLYLNTVYSSPEEAAGSGSATPRRARS